MYKVGSYVTRNKYNNDILFKIVEIKNNKAILRGVDLRLYADADIKDLKLSTINKDIEEFDLRNNLDIREYFYIPGTILHIDSDEDYLNRCLNFYKKEGIKCYGYKYSEKEYPNIINDLIKKHNPNIVVITGHDAFNKNKNIYKNSNYFIESVLNIKKINNNIIIVSGACQSNFEGLMKAGSSFASSPSRVNIHALDPAIIAVSIAKNECDKLIDLKETISKTKFGLDGFGGIEVFGIMHKGLPRKDKN
jgi:spore coat assembly protein